MSEPFIVDGGVPMREGRPEQRNTHDVLAEVADTLIQILAEVKRGNSVAREGAVSSVEIKFLAPTKDHPEGKPQPVIKAYAGSVLPVEEAIEAYGRAFLMSQQASMEGWEQTLDVLQNSPEYIAAQARLMNGEKP